MNQRKEISRDAVTELRVLTGKILENQTKTHRDIHDIKIRLFDPDTGLYTRVSKNTGFRKNSAKWLWLLTTGMTMSFLNSIMRYFLK